MKTTVIHHSADYDGIFCREIARKFLPDAELIGWDFGQALIELPSDGDVYVLDLPPDCLNIKLVDGLVENPVRGHLIWIDHHATAITKWPASLPGYRIDGVAACRLAWQWFSEFEMHNPTAERHAMIPGSSMPNRQNFIDRKVQEPVAVRLVGEYDIWDKRDPDAELFQHGLRSRDLTNFDWSQILSISRPPIEEVEKLMADGISHDLLNPDGTATPAVVCGLLNNGKVLQYAQRKQDEFVAKNRSFDVQWEGLRFMAINAVRCNSLTFESAVRQDHDALLGFYWNGKFWNVSLYHAPHRKDLDLSAIATKHGGGGHKGACGFRSEKLPFIP